MRMQGLKMGARCPKTGARLRYVSARCLDVSARCPSVDAQRRKTDAKGMRNACYGRRNLLGLGDLAAETQRVGDRDVREPVQGLSKGKNR
jgi:hypothetical protein